MTDITERLNQDVMDQARQYIGEDNVSYHAAVHAIAESLNDKYQRQWQQSKRGQSFKQEVAKSLVETMYANGYVLQPEERDAQTGTLFIPKVKAGQAKLTAFVRAA